MFWSHNVLFFQTVSSVLPPILALVFWYFEFTPLQLAFLFLDALSTEFMFIKTEEALATILLAVTAAATAAVLPTLDMSFLLLLFSDLEIFNFLSTRLSNSLQWDGH